MREFKNVTIIQSPYEADQFIAKMSQSDKFFGILTNDSDFLIYDTPGMIPLEHLFFKGNEIILRKFTSEKIAEILGIPKEVVNFFILELLTKIEITNCCRFIGQ